jgi:hypothetical protein
MKTKALLDFCDTIYATATARTSARLTNKPVHRVFRPQ